MLITLWEVLGDAMQRAMFLDNTFHATLPYNLSHGENTFTGKVIVSGNIH